MTKWTDEDKKLLLQHYDDYASRRKTWMMVDDFFPKRTLKEIRAKALIMRRTGEWERLYRQFGL